MPPQAKKNTRPADNGCMFPDCPSRWIGDELVTKLEGVKINLDRLATVSEQMSQQHIRNAEILKDLKHINESITKIDARIGEAFAVIDTKADMDDILPKETLVTKSDVGRLMLYTSGLILLLVAMIEFVKRNWT